MCSYTQAELEQCHPAPPAWASASALPLHMFWPDLEMSGQASRSLKWMELWSPPLWLPAHPLVEVLISRDMAQDGELGVRCWGGLSFAPQPLGLATPLMFLFSRFPSLLRDGGILASSPSVGILRSQAFGPPLALLSLGGQRAGSARWLVSNALSACNALSASPPSQVLL